MYSGLKCAMGHNWFYIVTILPGHAESLPGMNLRSALMPAHDQRGVPVSLESPDGSAPDRQMTVETNRFVSS
jgi:hypothetical protein